MRHYFDFVPNATTGAAVPGAIVKLFDASDTLIDIFADENGTPIETVSGVPNGAKTDGDGMFSLYVANGIYTVRFYVGDKVLKTIRNVELSQDVSELALGGTDGAALVGTQASADGAVARTVLDKFREAPLSPEDFGAKGDGVTNDTTAIQLLAAAIRLRGGGTIAFRAAATYLVGRQAVSYSGGVYQGWAPEDILNLYGLTKPLVIQGNGAKMIPPAGMKFGVFNENGSVNPTVAPYAGLGRASPYAWMIRIADCTASVSVYDLELDGNANALVKGGEAGDTGWQISCYGLALYNNTGGELIQNVVSHHHALDGFLIDGAWSGANQGKTAGRLVGCKGLNNGRQGLSIVGGRGYTFDNCDFSKTGRDNPFGMNPGAGVDIEAEGSKKIRDLVFNNCQMVDNLTSGVIADSGDSANCVFNDCLLIGTTGYAAVPNKPGFHFNRGTIIGAVANAYASATPELAAQFVDVTFLDDPAQTPDGVVFLNGASGPIVDLGSGGQNVLFKRCRFNLTGNGRLPSTALAIYEDNTMIQAYVGAAGVSRGTYRGVNSITGSVDLGLSSIEGLLNVNGATFGGKGLHGSASNNCLAFQAYDAGLDRTVRVVFYSDPALWGTNNGAQVGDLIIDPTPAVGGATMWSCNTAPGDALAKWTALSHAGQVAAQADSTAADVATLKADFNALLAKMRASGKMA